MRTSNRHREAEHARSPSACAVEGNGTTSNAQAGFTLLEVLVSTALFLIVTGAIYGLLEVARNDRFTTNQKVESMQNLRVALNTIGRDAVNAGRDYTRNGALLPNDFLVTQLGITADADNTRDMLTSVVPGNNLNANTLNPGVMTDQVSFVNRDDLFNRDDTSDFSQNMSVSISNGGGQAQGVVSNPLPNPTPNPDSFPRPQDLMVVSGQGTSVIAVVAAYTAATNTIVFAQGVGDPLGVNRAWSQSRLNPAVNSSMTPLAVVSRINWVAYKVQADGTLVRIVYGNRSGTEASQTQPLAYGVEDMQIAYVMRDGTVTDDPAANPANACQVRITIRARGSQIDKNTNEPVRITMSSTFSIRNLSYDV